MTIPVIFINCRKDPFLDDIMRLLKEYETRNRDTLHRFLGERVLLAETGRGDPLVRCYATIGHIVEVYTHQQWESYRSKTRVRSDSSYEWKPGQKKKVLYHMEDVQPIPVPFRLPPSAVRHGRTWAEYELLA